jgi:hypothetical protein
LEGGEVIRITEAKVAPTEKTVGQINRKCNDISSVDENK